MSSHVASGGLALVIALIVAIGLFTDLDVVGWLLGTSIVFAFLSAILTFGRAIAIATPPRPMPPLLPDDALPRYCVLVPLFREAHMVPGLVRSLSRLDYPAHKLDIIFICEAEDDFTREAAQAVNRPPFRTLVTPPPSAGEEPQTKPRALNHALFRSHSQLVTIYDAEDRPHPQQLRQAASALHAQPDWAAVQAPLEYYNIDDTPLAAQFALEYDAQFRVLLPFYDRLGLPFPLGGTSNHIRRSALTRVGGWDAFNVTEDADLAFRIAAAGHGIGWIDRPTQEEAVTTYRPWKRQRARWLKGFMMTWRVHMAAPFRGGWRRALMLQLTLAVTCLSILFYLPVIFALLAALLAQILGLATGGVPALYLSLLSFSLVGNMAIGVAGALRAGRPQLLRHVPFMPLYWILLFPPFLQALSEMRTRPFHWHKTRHGVTDATLHSSSTA